MVSKISDPTMFGIKICCILIEGFAFLQDTEIGKAVNLLRKHGSDKISKRAKTLIQ